MATTQAYQPDTPYLPWGLKGPRANMECRADGNAAAATF